MPEEEVAEAAAAAEGGGKMLAGGGRRACLVREVDNDGVTFLCWGGFNVGGSMVVG